MIPDDESVRRAMQSIEPPGTDVPDLFDRVAAGARRRRRQRSMGAVIAAAAVVVVVALVPALGRGTSTTNVQPIGPGASATRVQQLGIGSGQVSHSPVQPNFPGVGPSTIASPSALASSPLAVESPSPLMSSTPLVPPLVTSGACSGLSVAMTAADGQNLSGSTMVAEPSLNIVTATVGWTISFAASGPAACVNRLVLTETDGNFPTAKGKLQPNSTFTPLEIRPDGPGVEHVEVMLRPCSVAASCGGGQSLAEAMVSVDPPASSTASPVSSNLGACPTVLPLVPGADAAAQATAAVVKVVPTIYPPEPTKDFTVTAVYPASSSLYGGKGYGTIVYDTCGETIGDRTWVVEVHFPHDPNNSASTGNGQLFVSEFANGGWQVWFRNH
jgi:hypothetical protein